MNNDANANAGGLLELTFSLSSSSSSSLATSYSSAVDWEELPVSHRINQFLNNARAKTEREREKG